ncbi:MAG: DUF167 domain-containing protein [Anaerolineae bacterium]|nr:DUF167 domain-containing protein [Anaerolineae bacterium]
MSNKREFKITKASGGAAFSVRVVTRASRTELAGVQEDGILKVRLTESPDDGAANRQLIEFIAQTLGISPNKVEIVAGENSRDKLLSIDEIAPEILEEKLMTLTDFPEE